MGKARSIKGEWPKGEPGCGKLQLSESSKQEGEERSEREGKRRKEGGEWEVEA